MLYFETFDGEYASPIKECVAFLRENTLATLDLGRYYLGDSGIFVNLMEYDTKNYADGVFEAHRTLADFHVVVCGEETAFYGDVEGMTQGEYHEEGDYLLCETAAAVPSLHLSAGSGVVFMPQDAHMPGITADAPCHVRKAVFKIPLELF